MRTSILLLLPLMVACAPKMILDKGLVQTYELDEDKLASIQFYLTRDVVLTRYENQDQQASTEKGSLNISEGRVVEQIIIKGGTRGRAVKELEKGKLAISFEPDDSRFLVFGPSGMKGLYMLTAREWHRDRGIVDYAGKRYVTNEGAHNAAIAFKLKRSMKVEQRQYIARGNKVR